VLHSLRCPCKKPLDPCNEKRARQLLERGRARVHKLKPFTIHIVDRLEVTKLKYQTYEDCIAAVVADEPAPLRDLPPEFLTEKLCLMALQNENTVSRLVDVPLKFRSPKVCLAAVMNSDESAKELVSRIPTGSFNVTIVDRLLSEDPTVLPALPANYHTPSNVIIYVRKTHDIAPFEDLPFWNLQEIQEQLVSVWPEAVLMCLPTVDRDKVWMCALARDGRLLEKVDPNRLPEEVYRRMAEMALRNHAPALQFIPEHLLEKWGEDFVLTAVKRNTHVYKFLPEKLKLAWPGLARTAVDLCHHCCELGWVPESLRSRELCELAIRRTPISIEHVQNPDEDLIRLALDESDHVSGSCCIVNLIKDKMTPELWDYAKNLDPSVKVPEDECAVSPSL